MSKIAYDPIKDRFARWIKHSHVLRSLFYTLLDLFFLRSWHVRNVIRSLYENEFKDKPTFSVLDAGNGFGQYDRFLLRSFPNASVFAVDVKEDYLADCSHYFSSEIKKGRISFEPANLLEFQGDPTYDLAICIDVLEHIEEDVKVIKNVSTTLRPGGYFLMHSPSHLAEDDAGDDEFFVDEHARAGYSKQDISEKLTLAGLEPVNVHYTYGTFGHFAWEILIKYPMLWLTKTKAVGVLVLPFYYAVTLIPGLICMSIDLRSKNETGTGVYALGRKPGM